MGEAPSGKKNPREEAFRILCRVEEEDGYADILLDRALEGNWDERDKRLLVELVNGTVRWQGLLNHVLSPFVTGGLERLDSRSRNLLRLGAFQLLKTQKLPGYAVVNESVKTAKAMGLRSGPLTNAVLHAIIKGSKQLQWPSVEREPARFLSVKESHPEWLVKRWLGRYGYDRTKAICQIDNQPAKVMLRANRLKTTPEELLVKLSDEGLRAKKGAWSEENLILERGSPGNNQSFKDGLFQVQDEASTLVGKLAAPKLGELVVDLCAAPGGKATHLAEQMKDKGFVLAFDLHPGRLELVRENAQRLGLKCIVSVAADGRQVALKQKADLVLVDAPCSGTGVLRRRVDLRWRLKEGQIRELASLQAEMLENASSLVKPGGTLVYSTCTLEPEENEEVTRSFLAGHSEFGIEPADRFLPREVVEPGGWIATYPDRHGTDGGFAVRYKKRKP